MLYYVMFYYITLYFVVGEGGEGVYSFMYVYIHTHTHTHAHIGAAKMIGLMKPEGVEAHFIIGKSF
jgi:hypothetical protein